MSKILELLKQKSTYSGLFKLLAALGVYSISPELEAQFIAAALALAGLYDTFRNEKSGDA